MGNPLDSSLVIRLCRSTDIAAIARLNNEAIETGWAHFGTEPVPAHEMGALWESGRETYPWLIAETPGESGSESGPAFAGFAKAGVWKPRGGYRWTTEVGLYLKPSAQGRGIGTALYAKLFEFLSAQGFVVAFGGVATPNPASERLHESVGMTVAGDFEPSGYKLGAWRPVRYYVKVLNDHADGLEPAPTLPVSAVAAGVLGG